MRQTLVGMDVLRRDARVVRDADTVYLPVTMTVAVGHPVVERDVPEAAAPVRSYKDLADVPADLAPLLPTSFDVIGDIALVKVPEPLRGLEDRIGAAILAWNPALRVVAVDRGVAGDFRVRRVEVVAGEPRTRTVHREHGLVYAVDVAKVYFSPRLGTERLRIASRVRPGEVVADLFAGVGPYAILIARRAAPRVVHAVDANPDAVTLLRENVRTNRAHAVVPVQGDATEVLARIDPPTRILLDLPHSAREVLPDAVRRVAPGGTVHVYAILERAALGDERDHVRRTAEAAGRTVESLEAREVHTYAATMALFALDVRLS